MLIDDCIAADIRDVIIPKHLLRDAQVFVFDDETIKAIRELTEKVDYRDIQKQFMAPYPVTWVEQYSHDENADGSKYSIRFGWLIVTNPANAEEYEIFLCSGLGMKPRCNELYTNKGGVKRLYTLSWDGMREDVPLINAHMSNDMLEGDDLFWPVHAMMIYLFAMNFKELVNIERKDFSILNKKREKASKLPLRDRNIVTIKLKQNTYINIDKNTNSQQRNSPRMHLRRGHFMKYKERVIWRRVALIGKDGFIKKQYKIRNS